MKSTAGLKYWQTITHWKYIQISYITFLFYYLNDIFFLGGESKGVHERKYFLFLPIYFKGWLWINFMLFKFCEQKLKNREIESMAEPDKDITDGSLYLMTWC